MKKLLSLIVVLFGLSFGLNAQDSVIPNPDPNAADMKFEKAQMMIEFGVCYCEVKLL